VRTGALAVVDAITSIVSAWDGLRLGWAGSAASGRRVSAAGGLRRPGGSWGPAASWAPGAFGRLPGAVRVAWVSYGEAGGSSVKVFRGFFDGLTAPLGFPGRAACGVDDPVVAGNAPALS
jgi:hypothetical protein